MLTNEQIAGEATVKVYNTTASGEEVLEGDARIRKVQQGDRQGVYADVEFVTELGTTYGRWVFANQQ